MDRPDKTRYYLDIALSVAKRSPCKRRKYGAIIVVGDAIVSTGYNGPARGSTNCEIGCIKDLLNLPHLQAYEFCPAVHAEENAIINAARNGAAVKGGVLYISGYDVKTGEIVKAEPCERCKRAIINAGIEKIVIKTSDSYEEIKVKELVEDDKRRYEELFEESLKSLKKGN